MYFKESIIFINISIFFLNQSFFQNNILFYKFYELYKILGILNLTVNFKIRFIIIFSIVNQIYVYTFNLYVVII